MSRRMLSISMVLVAVAITGSALIVPSPAAPAAQASPAASTPCPTTTEEENKAMVRRFIEEVLSQGRFEGLDEVLTEDYVHHVSGGGFLPVGQSAGAGRAVLVESIQELRTDFPDWCITIAAIVAEGDLVAARMITAGTHSDPLDTWNAPETGRRMEREVWLFARVACGRTAEAWSMPNNLSMLRQLGIITDEELADAGFPTVATPVP